MPEFQLIDLEKDPGEKNNVIGKFPEKAQELKERLARIIADGRTRSAD